MTDGEKAALVKPVETVFSEYREIRLDEVQEKLYLNGVRLDAKRLHSPVTDGNRYRVYSNKFLGIADVLDGELISVKRF